MYAWYKKQESAIWSSNEMDFSVDKHDTKESIILFIDNAKELENRYLYGTVVGCLEAYRWRKNLNVEKILYSLNKIRNNRLDV